MRNHDTLAKIEAYKLKDSINWLMKEESISQEELRSIVWNMIDIINLLEKEFK